MAVWESLLLVAAIYALCLLVVVLFRQLGLMGIIDLDGSMSLLGLRVSVRTLGFVALFVLLVVLTVWILSWASGDARLG